jgi:hypothetical protein
MCIDSQGSPYIKGKTLKLRTEVEMKKKIEIGSQKK